MEIDYKNDIRYKAARKKVKDIKGFYIHLLVYLVINIALLVINTRDEGLLTGLEELSNYTTAFFWGIGLFAHWASIFGVNLFIGKQWEERKIRELMQKNKENRWE